MYHPRFKGNHHAIGLKYGGFDTDAVGYAKDILSGKFGFMCQYNNELNFDTVWSSLFDLSNHKIYRAEGNPARAKFKEDIRYNKIYIGIKT